MIYVLNKSEAIMDILEPQKERSYYNDMHVQDLKEGSETFEFTTDVDIAPNSTIVLRTTSGDLHPFIVQSIRQVSGTTRSKTYTCDGEFLELRYTRILEPQILSGQTPETALNFGLQGTRWQLGVVDSKVVKDVEIREYMNVLKYIRMLADLFNLEMRFRVEFSANTISARYVDLVERAGIDMGKEIVFGKDLQSIERVEDTSAIVTALYAVGPADDTGHYMSIESVNSGRKYVEDANALQRWGKDGEHRFDIFTPSVDTKKLTPQILKDLTTAELMKRINSFVSYKIDAVDLYDVLGMKHERVFLGDTGRIKDEGFTPALYVEARVIRTERSYTDPSLNKFTLGDYREIDIKTYRYIREIQSLLNNSKEKWNSAEENAVARAEVIISQTEESWGVTVQSLQEADGALSGQVSQLNIDLGGITTSVSNFDSRLGTAESNINQQAGQISSKVSQTDYNGNTIASLINQSATTIDIIASKINLLGITNVADTLNIGNRDNVGSKEIRFNGGNVITDNGTLLRISAQQLQLGDAYTYIGGEVSFSLATSVNFGNVAVSGLTVSNASYATNAGNADRLDGYDSSYFSISGHQHSNYVTKNSGDGVAGTGSQISSNGSVWVGSGFAGIGLYYYYNGWRKLADV